MFRGDIIVYVDTLEAYVRYLSNTATPVGPPRLSVRNFSPYTEGWYIYGQAEHRADLPLPYTAAIISSLAYIWWPRFKKLLSKIEFSREVRGFEVIEPHND